MVLDDRKVTLQIWDTAGQERYQALGSAFYRGADCCVLVYDITNPKTFDNLMNWRQVFLTKCDPVEPQSLPFLVIGNKSDVDTGRQVPTIDAKKFCQLNGMLFYETSARNNHNVEKAFKELIVRVIKRLEQLG